MRCTSPRTSSSRSPSPRVGRDLRLAGHRALPRVGRAGHACTPRTRSSTAPGQKDAGYITIQVAAGQRRDQRCSTPARHHRRACWAAAVCASAVPLDGIDARRRLASNWWVWIRRRGRAASSRPARTTWCTRRSTTPRASTDSPIACATASAQRRPPRSASASRRAESANQSPYAVKDSVVMRPGRSVAVPVMANDSDPDGDRVDLVSNALVAVRRGRPGGRGQGRPRRRDVT